jgi:Flp pilus assembly protein TadD
VTVYCDKAGTLLRMGQASAAIELFDQALRINPTYFMALAGKGDALAQAGQGDAAIALYEEALKLRPDDSGAARNLGIALLAAGRVSEAIARLRAVLRGDPQDASAHSISAMHFGKSDRLKRRSCILRRRRDCSPTPRRRTTTMHGLWHGRDD